MSAAAYAAFVRACTGPGSPSFLGDIDGAWSRPQSLAAAERIAALLDAHPGIGQGQAVIGIALPRDRRYLAAIFAIWARGDVVLPLDPAWPPGHLHHVLAIAQPALVIAAAGWSAAGQPVLHLPPPEAIEALAAPDAAQQARWASRRAAAALSYVIFTSGSTGGQKGVLIPASAYDAYRGWVARYWQGTGPYHALLLSSALTFDIALGDIAFALAHDADIHLSPAPANIFAHAWLIRDRAIDVLYAVPSTLARLFALAEARDDVRLDGLRLVIAGGDSFTPALIAQARRAAPRAAFHNVYGPTELTINCAAARVDDAAARIAAAGLVPIGPAFAHLDAHLADATPGPRAGWSQGELLVAGAQCMAGYLGDPEATARAFAEIGGRAHYRTGDLVLRDPDGYLYVLGRKDALVKIQGYRVNPLAVDAILLANPAVRDARTVAVRDRDGRARLVAFVVAAEPLAASLLRECRAALPSYAVPASIVAVDALPLTGSGKHDIAALRRLAG